MRRTIAVCLLLASVAADVAHAAPITYTFAEFGSGILNGVAFSNEVISVEISGNTSNIVALGSGNFENTGTGTLFIAGVDEGTFTPQLDVYEDILLNGIYSQVPAGPFDLIDVTPPTSTLNLVSDVLGANLGVTYGDSYYQANVVTGTTAGSFQITAADSTSWYSSVRCDSDSCEDAPPPPTPSPTPEPSTISLLGTGMAGLAALYRRRLVR